MFATIYTDASYGNNKYGYSYYTKCDKGVVSGSGVLDNCNDINEAEMLAIVFAIKESHKKHPSIKRILVVTDSITAQYTLWGNGKGSKKEKYKPVVDKFKALEKRFEKVMIKWTKGHRYDNSDRAYLNNKCDAMASRVVGCS